MPLTKPEADLKLRQAIIAHAEASGFLIAGELLEDYAVVASWRNMAEGEEGTHYTTHFHVWDIPQHAAIGLFRIGLTLALANEDE